MPGINGSGPRTLAQVRLHAARVPQLDGRMVEVYRLEIITLEGAAKLIGHAIMLAQGQPALDAAGALRLIAAGIEGTTHEPQPEAQSPSPEETQNEAGPEPSPTPRGPS